MSQSIKVAVAGGSLAGLMTGIEIRFAGADVDIHERSAGRLDDRGAGIVMQPETLQMLTQRCGLAEEESGVWLNYRQYLHPGGEPAHRQRMPQLPEVKPRYAGYVAWRGVVPESEADRALLLGDAAFVPRPHTAASTSKAAAI